MTARPTKSMEWGTGSIPAGPVYTLAQAKVGHVPDTFPAPQWFTEWQNAAYQWQQYLDGALTSIAGAAGTTVLSAASNDVQVLSGSSAQTYTLPDETTLAVGRAFKFYNLGTGVLTIKDSGGTTLLNVVAPTATNAFESAIMVSTSAAAATGGWKYSYKVTGPVVRAGVSQASPVALTSFTTANVTSIPLTEGDWDVKAMVGFAFAASTTTTVIQAAISKTTGALPSVNVIANPTSGETELGWSYPSGTSLAGGDVSLSISPYQVTVAVGATLQLFLVARSTFATSTAAAFGSMEARRMN